MTIFYDVEKINSGKKVATLVVEVEDFDGCIATVKDALRFLGVVFGIGFDYATYHASHKIFAGVKQGSKVLVLDPDECEKLADFYFLSEVVENRKKMVLRGHLEAVTVEGILEDFPHMEKNYQEYFEKYPLTAD